VKIIYCRSYYSSDKLFVTRWGNGGSYSELAETKN